ncbi:MAG: PD-(D/E)XK nuclease family protein [Longimicrobiaceae bacterium]
MTFAPPRTFLGWDRPALHSAAELITGVYAAGDAVDLGGAVMVLPGGRPGRRLKELLLEEAGRLGLRLVPPRVVTVGELPELLYQPSSPAADTLLARRAWSEALRSAEPPPRELFPDPPLRDDLRGWETLAGEVQRLHREVAGAGHSFRGVARICREGGQLFDDHLRWQALAAVQDRYGELLDEVGRADPDLARLQALEAEALGAEHDLWLVGVAEMPATLRRMLRASGATIRVLVHAPEGEAGAFDELGCVRPGAWAGREIDLPEELLRLSGGPADQADTVLVEMAALDGRFAAEEITIATPDEGLVPYLVQRLEAYGVPTRYGAGRELTSTPVYRFLAAAAEYLPGEASWQPFAALLRHPDVGDWLSGTEDKGAGPLDLDRVLEAADRFFSERLPDRPPRSLRSRPLDAPLAEARKRLARLLEPLGRRERLSVWPATIFNVLATLHGERTLRRERPRERGLLDTLDCFKNAALSFARLPERLDPWCDGATAISLLLESVRTGTIPDDPDRAAVELLGWLEVHLDDAPVVIVTGCNEPYLPSSLGAHPFLPDRLRTRLGLLDNTGRYARDAYHLTALLHDRERVRLIVGLVSAKGDPLRPSRLTLAARGEVLARRVLRFASESRPRMSLIPRRRAGEVSQLRLPPEPELRLEPPVEVRVTDLRRLLEDPYLYALEQLLGLRELNDDARELDGRGFGSLAHQLLQEFGHSPEAYSGDPEAVAHRLDSLLQKKARRFSDSLPAVRVQLEQLRARLHAFARWQAGWVTEGWEMVAVEGCPAGVGDERGRVDCRLEFEVDGEPIFITGRIDRVDRHRESGAWAVFDYKTSDAGEPPDKVHRRGRGAAKEWIDLQLPLYRHLARTLVDAGGAGLIPPQEPVGGLKLGYIRLPRDLAKTGAAIAEWSPAELKAADEAARQAVRTLRSGLFVFAGERVHRYAPAGIAALLGGRQLLAGAGGQQGGQG